MAAFVLAMIVNNYLNGQVSASLYSWICNPGVGVIGAILSKKLL